MNDPQSDVPAVAAGGSTAIASPSQTRILRRVGGDASFDVLLADQRLALAEAACAGDVDDDDAVLLPFMLSLARMTARVDVLAAARAVEGQRP